jgi:hypothetical protein
MGQCNAIAHVHFDGAQLNPPAATTAQEPEALLGTKPDLIGLCVGLKFDMQFNDEGKATAPQNCLRVRVRRCRHCTAHRRRAAHCTSRCVIIANFENNAKKSAARRAYSLQLQLYSTHVFTINHDQY